MRSWQIKGMPEKSVEQKQSRTDYLFPLGAALATAAAIWLRWAGLNAQSIWGDEGYTVWLSRLAPREIWHNLLYDTGPPLYYLVQHYWGLQFGSGPTAIRALSAVFATLSWPLEYLLIRKIVANRTAVVLALAFNAFSFLQIWYGQEARFYGLLLFLSLGSVYCLLLHLEKRSAVRFAGIVLCLTASLYVHNMTLFYLPGLALLWALYPSETPLSVRAKDAALAGLMVLLLYIPWLPTLRAQVRSVHHVFWYATPTARDFLDTFSALCGLDLLTLQLIFRDKLHLSSTTLFGAWTWGPLVLAVFIAFLWRLAPRSPENRKLLAVMAYAVLPVLLVFAQSRLSTPMFVSRVLLTSSFFIPLAFCLPFTRSAAQGKWIYQSVAILILAGCAASCFIFPRRYHRDDWRGVTQYLVSERESPRLVVVSPDLMQFMVQYYAPNPPAGMEVSGLMSKYNPPDPDLQSRILELDQHADTLAPESWKKWEAYREIDLVLAAQAFRTVNPTLEYLARRCASLENVEFDHLEIKRCQLNGPAGGGGGSSAGGAGSSGR